MHTKAQLYIRLVAFIVALFAHFGVLNAQTPWQYLLSQSQFEASYQMNFVGDMLWETDQQMTQPLSHLTPEDDILGLKSDQLSNSRPFNARYTNEGSLNCCKTSSRRRTPELNVSWVIPIKEHRKILVGPIFTYNRSFFQAPERSANTDAAFGNSNTVYYKEVGLYDTVRIFQKNGGIDTTYAYQRTKMVTVERPQEFFGLGLRSKFILHEDVDRKWLVTAHLSFVISSSRRAPTTIYASYFDYNSWPEYSTARIGSAKLSEGDIVEWINPVDTDERVVIFEAPQIWGRRLNYGIGVSVKPLDKLPMRLALQSGISEHRFVQKGELLAKANSLNLGLIMTLQL